MFDDPEAILYFPSPFLAPNLTAENTRRVSKLFARALCFENKIVQINKGAAAVWRAPRWSYYWVADPLPRNKSLFCLMTSTHVLAILSGQYESQTSDLFTCANRFTWRKFTPIVAINATTATFGWSEEKRQWKRKSCRVPSNSWGEPIDTIVDESNESRPVCAQALYAEVKPPITFELMLLSKRGFNDNQEIGVKHLPWESPVRLLYPGGQANGALLNGVEV